MVKRSISALTGLLAVTTLVGCALLAPPPLREASPTVTSPSGRLRAHVQVSYLAGKVTVSSGRPDEVIHSLLLTRTTTSTEEKITLGRFTSGYLGTTPKLEYLAARRARCEIEFAPDEHALAVSCDGSRQHWQYVALDDGPAAMVCGRWKVTPPSAPFGNGGNAETTAALVIQDFDRASDAPGSGCEWAGMVRFACAHPTDVALGQAGARALVAQDRADSDRDPLVDCLRDVARAQPEVRAILVRTVQNVSLQPAQRGQAAEALASTDDADTQTALATAVAAEAQVSHEDSDHCWMRAKLTWALASVTSRRHAGSTAAKDALAAMARAPDSCPEQLTGKVTRVYAVAGLGALGDRATLDALIKEAPCAQPLDGKEWPIPFVRWNETLAARITPLSCWAQAALGSK